MALLVAASFARFVHPRLDNIEITVSKADDINIQIKENGKEFKKTILSGYEGKIPINETENKLKVPVVQGCAVFAEKSHATCFVDSLLDEVLSPSLSEDPDTVTTTAARKAGGVRLRDADRVGIVQAPRASLRASIAFCNHALKHLAVVAASASEPIVDTISERTTEVATEATIDDDHLTTSASAAGGGKMPRILECSIHLSQGTHLLQPHLFGPLTVATTSYTYTADSQKNVGLPPQRKQSWNPHGNLKSSNNPSTIYSVSIIGHPSGSSSLEVEESSLYSLLHVKNAQSASTSTSLGEKFQQCSSYLAVDDITVSIYCFCILYRCQSIILSSFSFCSRLVFSLLLALVVC